MTDVPSAARLRRVVRLTIAAGKGGEARAALATLRGVTLGEPGCDEFEFYQSITDDRAFVLIEDFADETALALHLDMPYTRAFFDLGLVERADPIAREWMA